MLKEFKEFAFKGNMIDMAVGIIMGGAFGLVVKSLVDNIVMPLAGFMLGGVDFKDKFAVLTKGDTAPEFANLAMAEKALEDGASFSLLKYGVFINDFINLLIIAFSIFIMVKYVASKMAKEEEEEDPGPSDNDLLTEIRDSLAK